MLESKSRRVVMVQNIYLNKNEKNKISFQDIFEISWLTGNNRIPRDSDVSKKRVKRHRLSTSWLLQVMEGLGESFHSPKWITNSIIQL